AQHQGLHQGGTGELTVTADPASLAGGGFGLVGEQGLQGDRQIAKNNHKRLLCRMLCDNIHPKREEPLQLRLLKLERMVPCPRLCVGMAPCSTLFDGLPSFACRW